jgi:DNA-binding CsgD family transcriptional regulator
MSRTDGSRGVVAQIERRLASVERELAGYERLLAERERLRAARAALLGESKSGRQVSQDDVAAYLAEHPGARPSEIAEALGVSANRVSAHLFRGKTDRFVSRERGWWLR